MTRGKRGLGWLSALLASGALLLALTVAPTALATPVGDLAQLPGTAGCLSEDGFDVPGVNGTAGACSDSRGADPAGLVAANDIAASPDGEHLYVAARSSFVTGYARDEVTGGITSLAGPGGCKSDAVVTGCEQQTTLGGATGVAVSPDGENVYVSTRDDRSVVGFARDGGTGALTPIAGTGGCAKELAPFAPCSDGRGLSSGADVAVTPDGENVYVAAGLIGGSDAIAVFDRDDTTGAITQKAGTAGCISDNGADFQTAGSTPGACANATRPLNDPVKLVVSPDGDHLYVGLNANNGTAPDPGVVVFDIEADGSLTESSCITQTGTPPCADGRGMGVVQALAISPDGDTVYAGSNTGSGVVAVLDRDQGTGELTQDPGTEGCLGGLAVEICAIGRHLRALGLTVSPDGKNVYVGSATDGVAVLDRDADGDLSQLPATVIAECWTELPTAGCTNGRAISDPQAFAFDPGGEFLYVAADQSRAVSVFDRLLDDSADLEASVSVDHSELEEDQLAVVVATATNNGPNRADAVEFEIDLSGAFDYDALNSDPACSEMGGTVTCTVTSLASGATAERYFYFTVRSSGTLDVDANVSSSGFDPVPANNDAQTSATVFPPPTGGASIDIGDFVIAEGIAFGGVGGLIKVDPHDGERTTITSSNAPSGAPALGPTLAVGFEASGALLVASQAPHSSLVRVDPASGARSLVSDNSSPGDGSSEFVAPSDLLIEPSGDVLVLNFGGGPDSDGSLVRVDAATGERTLLSAGGAGGRGSGPALGSPAGIELEPSGDFLVSCNCIGGPGLLRVDRTTGDRTIVSGVGGAVGSGPDPDEWANLQLAPDGNSVYYVDSGRPGILSIDLSSGDRTVVSDNSSPGGHTYIYPWGVSMDAGGDLIVTDAVWGATLGPASVVRVDPATGEKETLSIETAPSGGPSMTLPVGVAIRTALDADLSLLAAAPAEVSSGGPVEFTLTVGNNGPASVPSASVEDQLPAGFVYDDASSSSGCAPGPGGGKVTCTTGALASGQSVQLSIKGTAPAGPATLLNSATVSGAENDPSPANNSASSSTSVGAPLVLEPEREERLVVDNIQGTVLIRGPDGEYIPLTGDQVIPVGTVLDTTNGSVEVVSEGRKGRIRSAIFSEGLFQIQQAEGGRITEAVLKGGGINSCQVKPIRGGKAKKKKPKRSLYASGGSGHRTTGAYGSATVRGTEWKTIDTCKGTRLLAIEDSITVNDFVRDREVIVREGDSYMARSR